MKLLTLVAALLLSALFATAALPGQKTLQRRLESAEQVPLAMLPPAVRASIQLAYPEATIVAAHKLTRGKDARYEIELKAKDADVPFTVMATSTGTIRDGRKKAVKNSAPARRRGPQAQGTTETAADNHAHHAAGATSADQPTGGINLEIVSDTTISESRAYAGGHIRAGATLTLDPSATVTLIFTHNVIVEGALVSHPAPGVTHTIRFEGVDESAYVGSGDTPLASDVGLWVTGGRLDLSGEEKTSWARLASGVSAGTRSLTLEQEATGWRAGDTIVIAPTNPPVDRSFSTEFDEGRITTVAGRTITLASPLLYNHPAVDGRWAPEVFVLNRNMILEGTPGGRAHVWIRSGQSQRLSNVEIRYMGPFNASDPDATVIGRYPLHFHHSLDGTRGSTVRNVIVHHSANRAFVAHASYGITFTGTVAYDVQQTPYWWDAPTPGLQRKVPDRSNDGRDITYDRALAALVRPGVPFRGYRLAGFQVNAGKNLRLTNSVAVGVQGNKNSSGFAWVSNQTDEPWIFEGNLAHNNKRNGIFVWQNTRVRHNIANFIAYHNGGAGIEHGAYSNAFIYDRLNLFGNFDAGIRLHAQGRDAAGGLIFRCVEVNGAGITRAGVLINGSPVQANAAHFQGFDVRGITGPEFEVLPDAASRGDTIESRIRRAAADCG